jgi:putative aminopeptidase FrvX
MRLACSTLALMVAGLLQAQDPIGTADSLGTYGRVVQSWVALRVSPGREAYAIDRIRELGAWRPAALGSLAITRGEGSPHRVLACGLDETSYVVSHITDDGYLRVHLAGGRARAPLSDSWHVGQRIIVLTTARATSARVRAVPGVFAVRSTHLWRRAPGTVDPPPTLDDLWIDVGVRTRAEVAALGIQILDPVFRDMPDWSVGDAVVGPSAAARAGCAAVAAAAASEQAPAVGRTTFVVSTQSSFNWTGLAGVLAGLGYVDSLIVVHPSALRTSDAAAVSLGAAALPSLRSIGVGAVGALNVRARFPGTLVEAVSEADLRSFFAMVAAAGGIAPHDDPRRLRVSIASIRTPYATDSLSRFAEMLSRLTDTYSVSGDEAAMRDVVRARLPAWARELATTDTAGNLVVSMGPDRDTVVFIAHMDEVGFEVIRAANGVATLRPLGGFYGSLFTGQTALLHLESAERAQGCRPTSGGLRGVFLQPDTSARTREVQAWFGDQLASAGAVSGAKVTSFKCATRLAATRFTARSIDDRLGSAALVMALEQFTPARLANKVIFIWSVREETGLDGARAAAADLGISVRRVHAVDTFVSADSPLETGRFAVAPIGSGAVVRALDNSSVAPPDEIDRVVRIARSVGIPLQIGTTNGGNDGSAFTPLGAVDVPLSWPLRYSHSPAELIDLRDLRSLARLVAALAVAPVR